MDYILTNEFEGRAEHLMNTFHVPGISVSTTTAEKTVSKGFGRADIEGRRGVTSRTIFESSSASKCLTAAAAATLVAKGRLEWATPVRSILPAFRLQNEVEATVQDLLSHNTGIPNHAFSLMDWTARKPDTPISVAAKVCHLTPGTRRDAYSNPMYTTASFLIEAVSGEKFASYLTANVLEPLGMKSTYVQPDAVPAAKRQRRAGQYAWLCNTSTFTPEDTPDKPECQGASMMQSSTEDYARWLRANLARDPALFECPEMYAALMEPRTKNNNARQRPHSGHDAFSLGWNVREYRGRRVLYQDGRTGRAMLVPDVEEPFGIVIFGNSAGAEDVAEVLCMELIDRSLGVPRASLGHWEPLQKAIANARPLDGLSLEQVKEEARTSCIGHLLNDPDVADDNNNSSSSSNPSWQSTTTTPFPLTDYTGRFRNKAYGDIWLSTIQTHPLRSRPRPAAAAAGAEAGNGAAAATRRPIEATTLQLIAHDRTEPFTLTLEPCGYCDCDRHEGTMTKFVAVRTQGRKKVDCIRVEASTSYDPVGGGPGSDVPPTEVVDPEWHYRPNIKRMGLDFEREIGFPGLVWFQRASVMDVSDSDSDSDSDSEDEDEDEEDEEEKKKRKMWTEYESDMLKRMPPEFRSCLRGGGDMNIPGIS
ncbi:hypothetical protein H2204_005065 [Knufia peltigerae]|uniref:Beta-lactamase-related domain-containing protein n=1 Tax=Knufia peltigerae TaxID=1002370 RepID=A0AA39CXX5_9EURO|nr:hypothetical protein H2204_005065 [Knufia peltigerae]